jgi:hypothetical protein
LLNINVVQFSLKGFEHKLRATPCAKMPDDEYALKGLKLLPFQGVHGAGLFNVGRCPTFMLSPFQGKKFLAMRHRIKRCK